MNAINQVKEAAQEHINKMVEMMKNKNADEGTIFTERDEKFYRLELILPVVRSISKYLVESDNFKSIRISRNTDLVQIYGIIERDSKEYNYNTEIITAGGCNIQCLHHRYITKSNLPVNKDESAINAIKAEMSKMTKAEALNEKIESCQRMNSRETKELDALTLIKSGSNEVLLAYFHDRCYWSSNPSVRDGQSDEAKIEIAIARLKNEISNNKKHINHNNKLIAKYELALKNL